MMIKNIPNYENYSIDTMGNVFSKKARKYMKHDIDPNNKVHKVKLWDGKKHRAFSVIKLMAITFIKNINPSLYKIAITKNGNQDDLHIKNIMWATHSIKQRRTRARHPECKEFFRASKGVKIKFDNQKMSKFASRRKRNKNGVFINELTEEQINNLKQMYIVGYSLKELTDIFPIKSKSWVLSKTINIQSK